MIKIASLKFSELGKVSNIELRSCEFPLGNNEIQEVLDKKGGVCFLATLSGTGVGWVAGQYYDDAKAMQVTHLAVHPSFRRRGFGRQLLGYLWNEAVKKGAKTIYILVPDYQMQKDDPDSVVDFMDHMRFRAVGVYNDFFFRYNRSYDAIKLERAT